MATLLETVMRKYTIPCRLWLNYDVKTLKFPYSFSFYIDIITATPKIGKVKAVIHRKPDASWSLKSATVSQSSNGNFWCSVLFEYENQVSSVCIDTDKAIGLDCQPPRLGF